MNTYIRAHRVDFEALLGGDGPASIARRRYDTEEVWDSLCCELCAWCLFVGLEQLSTVMRECDRYSPLIGRKCYTIHFGAYGACKLGQEDGPCAADEEHSDQGGHPRICAQRDDD